MQQRADSRRQRTGDSLAKAYPPDHAADETLDQLIAQLGQVPWPRAPANHGEGGNDARH